MKKWDEGSDHFDHSCDYLYCHGSGRMGRTHMDDGKTLHEGCYADYIRLKENPINEAPQQMYENMVYWLSKEFREGKPGWEEYVAHKVAGVIKRLVEFNKK